MLLRGATNLMLEQLATTQNSSYKDPQTNDILKLK